MGEEAIPEWALRRVCELTNVDGSGYTTDTLTQRRVSSFSIGQAFARYIASHEEPPVDPLLIEAREIVAQTQHDWPDSPWHLNEAAELRAGNRDYTLVLKGTLAGLRRGIEIAREEGR